MPNRNQKPVDFFREAAPYIHTHRGKVFVIAISGEALLDVHAKEILSDIAILSSLGARIVLVHGARPQIDSELNKNNHKASVHQDIRVTDKKTLNCSKAAVGALRLEIENELNTALNNPPILNNNLGVMSGNFITAKPIGVINGIDFTFTGKVRRINDDLLHQVLKSGNIALLSPLGNSPTGQIYNLQHEEVASFTASKINADKLIFIHKRTDIDIPKQINVNDLKSITNDVNRHFIDEITNAIIGGNVERVHLIQAGVEGELLLELYTRDGAGRMITSGKYDQPRNAGVDDIGGILDLTRPLEESGALATRTRETLELEIQNFSVIERDGKIIGCAALHLIDGTSYAELGCLAVHPNYRKENRGIDLVEHIAANAKLLGVKKLFILTTQSFDWFQERGFEPSAVDELPDCRKSLYDQKRKSKVMIRTI